ncbi:hypothetical protein ACOMYX_04850 [Pantoea agglomerans]
MEVNNFIHILMHHYSCVYVFIESIFSMAAVSSRGGVFAEKNLHVALNMAGVGFLLGIILWLFYYLPYRKRNLNKTKS